MSMGDLTSYSRARGTSVPSGSFRGSRNTRVVVEIYVQDDTELPAVLDVTDFVTSVTTSKSINGDPGSFSIGLKSRGSSLCRDPLPPIFSASSWEDLILDGDWVGIAFYDGLQQWLVMDGIVDSVQRTTSGGGDGQRVDEWRIVGRDVTKALAETDLAMAPFAKFDIVKQYGIFFLDLLPF